MDPHINAAAGLYRGGGGGEAGKALKASGRAPPRGNTAWTYTATRSGFLSALWETAYGRLLLLKLCGVLGMVGLGAINRYRGLPGLRDCAQGSPISHHAPSGGVRFLRIATVESMLAVWVLGCTAVLTGASPPRQGSPADATHHAAAAEVSTALC